MLEILEQVLSLLNCPTSITLNTGIKCCFVANYISPTNNCRDTDIVSVIISPVSGHYVMLCQSICDYFTKYSLLIHVGVCLQTWTEAGVAAL